MTNDQDRAPAQPRWNTDDLYFDRSGKLVIKNRALAREIAKTLGQSGGMVLHFAAPTKEEMEERACPPTLPVVLCPMPNRMCPDSYCGVDAVLVGVQPKR